MLMIMIKNKLLSKIHAKGCFVYVKFANWNATKIATGRNAKEARS